MTYNRPIKAVFFDLDGTLLDTAPDLADACNALLAEYQRPPIPLTEFREWIHGGAMRMVCESFQIRTEHPDYPTIKAALLQNYQKRLTQKTRLFPGIKQVLRYLETAQIPWGIVTNKHAYLTQPLLNHFELTERCCCIISGDTLPTAKPHPAPLLHACELMHILPQDSVYVGDTLGDIQAAQAAHMRSIAVSYGYRPTGSKIEEWGADAYVASPDALLSVFKQCHECSDLDIT